MLAPRRQLGKNPDIHGKEACRMHEAPQEVQDVWKPFMQYQFVRSCSICTNVAESGVTVANVGLVLIGERFWEPWTQKPGNGLLRSFGGFLEGFCLFKGVPHIERLKSDNVSAPPPQRAGEQK